VQSTLNETGFSQRSDAETDVWQRLSPHLETAMSKLGESDRALLVLRFYENKSGPEAAALLGIREGTAHKRAARAIEKLRKFFAKQGVSSTSAIIAGVISAHSVHTAPAALAKSVTVAAIAKGTAANGSILTLVKGALKVMAWTKAKTAIVVGVGILLAAGTTTVTIREIQEHRTYSWEVPKWRAKILNEVPPQVRIVPAKFPTGGMGWVNGKGMGIGQPLSSIFPNAYQFNWARTLCKVQLPSGKYDFIANLPEGSAEALGREIERKFDLKVTRKTVQTDVLLLTVRSSGMPGLKPASSQPTQLNEDDNRFQGSNTSLVNLSSFLESCFKIPVVNGTGLTQNFDIDLTWNRNDPTHDSLKQVLFDQLGLELVPTNMPIEMLVIEKGS